MENFLNVKLALTPWIKVLFYFGARKKLTEEEGFLYNIGVVVL